MGFLQTLIGGLLGGGLIGLIEFLIRRADDKKDKESGVMKAIAELREEIRKIDRKNDEREAENRRVRILRFEDELLEERRHSKDSFDQVMNDITEYERYCDEHPEFKNNQTMATIAHITKMYNDRLDKKDFL